MVDHSARQSIVLQRRHYKKRLSILQVNKIEAIAARSFTDDINLKRGALSAPRLSFRPGQRDDASNCTFVTLTPII